MKYLFKKKKKKQMCGLFMATWLWKVRGKNVIGQRDELLRAS